MYSQRHTQRYKHANTSTHLHTDTCSRDVPTHTPGHILLQARWHEQLPTDTYSYTDSQVQTYTSPCIYASTFILCACACVCVCFHKDRILTDNRHNKSGTSPRSEQVTWPFARKTLGSRRVIGGSGKHVGDNGDECSADSERVHCGLIQVCKFQNVSRPTPSEHIQTPSA